MSKTLFISFFVCIVGLTIIFGSSYAVNNNIFAKPTPTPIPVELSSDKLWSLIQNWRLSAGFQIYTKDQRLCDIANDRVDDPKLDHHQGFYDKYSNYPYVIQENLVTAPSEELALNSWIHSQAHLETLQKNYQYSCLATKGNYAVQIFSNF